MTTNPSIPILDLKEQYKQVGNSIESKVIEILRSGHYILGKYGAELEEEVAAFCGVRFGVAVANGTDALILALWSLDIGPGDEVITPPFTFAATAEAIALRGAKPVFVDVDPITFNIRPDLIEAAITERTKAILPVHLYGQPANMEAICAIAEKHGLRIVEDNAQGIGASRKGHPTGSWGDLACISFYPTKNLGAAGDAGMIVTDNEDLARRLKVLRAHGSAVRYFHDELGVNSRLDEIQAAVLLTKLPFLRQWNSQRNTVARWYEECLRNTPGIILPVINADNVHAWHQYTVRVTTGGTIEADKQLRDELAKELNARGIGSMCYYPVPLHLQQAFADERYTVGAFPVSEQLAAQVLSLPMYPELAYGQVMRISKEIKAILANKISASAYVSPSVMTGVVP
ncbi:MAG: DegT/DnrJ/EryC1/StrS family aminotransferase [Candidatus Obscuribacterales bacterium]|nr:DegT/DnrJ/EryC1/StrS family aminotransferase [Candidatus Obscuribacterales bacterium]